LKNETETADSCLPLPANYAIIFTDEPFLLEITALSGGKTFRSGQALNKIVM